ncbi:MAG: hypothetical protein V4636_18240 [Pseudomonadota bacterium]
MKWQDKGLDGIWRRSPIEQSEKRDRCVAMIDGTGISRQEERTDRPTAGAQTHVDRSAAVPDVRYVDGGGAEQLPGEIKLSSF